MGTGRHTRTARAPDFLVSSPRKRVNIFAKPPAFWCFCQFSGLRSLVLLVVVVVAVVGGGDEEDRDDEEPNTQCTPSHPTSTARKTHPSISTTPSAPACTARWYSLVEQYGRSPSGSTQAPET
jgi:hypothetical protein